MTLNFMQGERMNKLNLLQLNDPLVVGNTNISIIGIIPIINYSNSNNNMYNTHYTHTPHT